MSGDSPWTVRHLGVGRIHITYDETKNRVPVDRHELLLGDAASERLAALLAQASAERDEALEAVELLEDERSRLQADFDWQKRAIAAEEELQVATKALQRVAFNDLDAIAARDAALDALHSMGFVAIKHMEVDA